MELNRSFFIPSSEAFENNPLPHFVIPPPVDCRIPIIDPLKTWTAPVVVVDDPAFQHQIPAQAALEAFQSQMLEHMSVVMYRNAPLGIVIYLVGLIHSRPCAIAHHSTSV